MGDDRGGTESTIAFGYSVLQPLDKEAELSLPPPGARQLGALVCARS